MEELPPYKHPGDFIPTNFSLLCPKKRQPQVYFFTKPKKGRCWEGFSAIWSQNEKSQNSFPQDSWKTF